MAIPSKPAPEASAQTRVRGAYERLASSYDRVTRRWKLIGYNDAAYRREAIDALDLQPGATVIELGCGTGANHAAVLKRIGTAGRLVAVDLSPAMLDQARIRARRNGWDNIEFVNGDISAFEFPAAVDAIFSTFVLAFVPECGRAVTRACRALKVGGRWAVTDQKMPDWGLSVIAPVYAAITRRYGISRQMMVRRPWLAVREAMQAELVDLSWRKRYLGFAYVASGRRAAARFVVQV